MGTVRGTWEFSLALTHVEQQGGGGKWTPQTQYPVLSFKKNLSDLNFVPLILQRVFRSLVKVHTSARER